MAVAENFNLRSRVAGVAVGLICLATAFHNAGQGKGVDGVGQYILYGTSLLCVGGGAALLAISLTGFGNPVQHQPDAKECGFHSSTPYQVVTLEQEMQAIGKQRQDRVMDGGIALVFSALATQMDPGTGGDLLAMALAGYGAGSMIGVVYNTARLAWLQRKKDSHKPAP